MDRMNILFLKMMPLFVGLIILFACLSIIGYLIVRHKENDAQRKEVRSQLEGVVFVAIITAIVGAVYWARVIEPFLNTGN